jgi:ABC-type bacteriocin/lantibiotic exporter with double-glycine peptidase domain
MLFAFKIVFYYFSKLRNSFFLVFGLSTFSSLFNALSAVSLIPIIGILIGDEFNSEYINKVGEFFNINLNDIGKSIYILIFVLFFIISGVIKVLNDYFLIKLRFNILSKYFYDLIKKIFLSNWQFFSVNDIGKISNSIYKELDKVGGTLIAVLHIISNFFLVSIIILVPLTISWKVTLFSFLSIIILLFPLKILHSIFYKIGKNYTKEASNFSKLFFYAISLFKNISANNKNKKTLDQIHNSFIKISYLEIKNKVINSSISEFLKIITIGFVVIVFFFSTLFNLSIAETAAILYSFLRIFPIANDSIAMINTIFSSKAGFELIESLKLKTSYIENENNWGNVEFKNLKKNVTLKNIYYKYTDQKNCLQDINIEIKKGEMVGVIGSSGSGKSTMLDLIAGLNLPQKGNLTLDNISLHEYKKDKYSNNIGYVDTSIELLPISIKDNITLFCEDYTKEDLEFAYKFSHCENFINKLEFKDQTIVGERGSTLSSGQKQRICIARAIIKRPSILILDEATNYLDDKNEVSIMENLKSLKDTTIIFATHKKSIEKFFDKIIKLDNGRIIN